MDDISYEYRLIVLNLNKFVLGINFRQKKADTKSAKIARESVVINGSLDTVHQKLVIQSP